jgi:hypothetical protein
MRYSRIAGRLRYQSIYECSDCGNGRVGDSESLEVDVSSADELRDALAREPQRSGAMPLGWARDSDGFHCGCSYAHAGLLVQHWYRTGRVPLSKTGEDPCRVVQEIVDENLGNAYSNGGLADTPEAEAGSLTSYSADFDHLEQHRPLVRYVRDWQRRNPR